MNNKKSTKRALLSSVLSLVLCMAMLIGTTFAWFTDSVTSSNNIIKSGNLDVELEYSTDMTNWNKVTETTNIFKEGALWEPGYTEVVYLRVSNLGSLALKYNLGVNVVSETPGINKAGESFNLSNYIEFGVIDPVTAAFSGREVARAAVTDAKKLATGYTKEGTLTAGQAPSVVAMVVYMPESVGNEANHNGNAPEIKLGLNLFATQLASEIDSFDNQYDKDAVYADAYVTDAAELADAIAKGGTVALMNDIEVSSINVPKGVTATINLNGNDISGTSTKDSGNQSAFVVKGDLVVEGIGVVDHVHTGANMGWGNLTSVFSVEGGTLTLGEGVNVVNNGGSDMAFGVDVNSTLGTTTLNVNGATIYSTYTGVRIFSNHTTAKGIVNFNDGFVAGDNRDIWHQVSNVNIPAENGVVNIADGYNYTTEATSYGGAKYFFGDYDVVADVDDLANVLEAGGDVIYAGSELDIDKTLNIKGNLTINNAVINTAIGDESAVVVDGGSLTLGKGTVLSVDEQMPNEGVIRVIDESEIVLDGAKITDCNNNGKGVLINVAAGAEMTIEDGTVISGNTITGSSSGTRYALINVFGKLTMNGGEISNNEFAHKTLISVERDGKLIINGGTIADNTFTGTGAASVIMTFMSATVEMNGGTISGNDLGSNSNSAVFNTSSNKNAGALVVNGGTVTNNMAGNTDKFAYIRGFDSVNIASAANVSGSVYDFWDGITKDVNDIKK